MRTPILLLLALLALPRAVAAQTERERDLWVPGQTTALVDDSLALRRNPAGLAHLDGAEFQLLLAQTGEGGEAGRGSSGWLGLGFGPLALGLGAEWLRGDEVRDAQVTRLGLGLGDDALALGLSVGWWSGRDPELDEAVTFDWGLSGRLGRHLAWGFSAQDLFTRTRESRLAVGLGVQVLADRLTVGVDQVWWGGGSPVADDSRTLASLRGSLVRGFHVLAGLSRRVGDGDVGLQLGVGLDLAQLGVWGTQATAGDFAAEGATGLRLSSARHPSLVEPPALVHVDLGEALAPPGASLLPTAPRDPLVELVRLLDQARRDPAVSGVLFELGPEADLSLAQAEELRRAVAELRRVGKRSVFYLEDAEDAGYYLAASGDRVLADPAAALRVNGLAATGLFFAEGLSKIGVQPEFVRVGAYKSAPDRFTREDMSEAEREMSEAVLDDLWGRWLDRVAEDRGLGREALLEAVSAGILSAEGAREAGLVDELAHVDELADRLGPAGRPARIVRHYGRRTQARLAWGRSPLVAVIPVTGLIVPGRTPTGPFAAGATGDETVRRALEAAAGDPRVAAIVLRIDSGGGDAGASDRMWRAARRAAEDKPVIASLGSVAASGGYYVAAGADTIVADASTLTGSIGIFAGHVDLSGLLDKLGIGVTRLERGAKADLLGFSAPWTEEERARMQAWVEEGYRLFLDRVATTRPLTATEVDAVGRGRVWTGAQALDHRLVDAVGTFEEAVARAKAAAGIEADAVVDIAFYGELPGTLAAFSGEGAPLSRVPARWQALVERAALLETGRPLALMPRQIEVR